MTNKETAKLLRSAASAIEHGRRSTFQKKLAQLFSEEERDGLLCIVERALADVENYLLSGNGARDYGDTYGEVLDETAGYFDAMTVLCAKIGLPGHFEAVSANIRAYRWEWAAGLLDDRERSLGRSKEEKQQYGSQLSDENSVR